MRTSRPGRVRTERAEARLQRAEALPVVGLEPEGGVHQPLAQAGRAIRPLEPDGGELGVAVFEQTLEVAAPDDRAARQANARGDTLFVFNEELERRVRLYATPAGRETPGDR